MPQEVNQTIRTTFVKGLLTEYSELNFPEDASIDELNCDLRQSGNRTRRLGASYETNHELTSQQYVEGLLYSTGVWENVGGDSNIEFVVVQAGRFLRFYQKGAVPLSSGIVPISNSNSNPYIIDMTPYEVTGGLGSQASRVSLASVNGYLVVASPQIDTFYILRDPTTNAFTIKRIEFKVRDFNFYGDPDQRTKEDPAPVLVGRQYDTKNCGWVAPKGDTALVAYTTANGAYPPLTHPWYSGKDSSGNFSVAEWEKVYAGNTITANGHYILDLFNPDRDGVSGITGVRYDDGREIPVPTGRFNAVASYAGRVFYGGVGPNIYFSRILEDTNFIGDCYQVNDPTSEEFSDLLDTDGGYVRIPDISGVKKLHVFGAALLVFADNGVWKISGVDDVFRATEYSVSKITDFGLAQKSSFVAGSNNQPFWWSYIGIHSVAVDDNGSLREINLSKQTIQSFWDKIFGDAKGFVFGEYDEIQNKVLWFYPDNDETVEYKVNNILFLDVDLQAFYPWRVSDTTGDTPQIVGSTFFSGSGSIDTIFNVVDESGNLVLDSSGNNVVVSRTAGSIGSSTVYLLVRDPTGALTFAQFNDSSFVDWEEVEYPSYAESAYNFIGDLSRKKNSPYITVLLRVTETGWASTGSGYAPVRPSSMKVSAYWDFKKTPSTPPQEAYRYKHPLSVNTGSLSTFTYPTTVITTRLKLRGRGRVVRLRFDATSGMDFNLLGWETLDVRKTTY